MTGEYDLDRFVGIQRAVYAPAVAMLRRGASCAPHVGCIFPAPALCDPASHGPLAIRSLDEAHAYLSSPLLGGRYRECIGLLQRLAGRGVMEVFAADAPGLQASLTLFWAASDGEFLIETMLLAWFGGLLHEETMVAIRRAEL